MSSLPPQAGPAFEILEPRLLLSASATVLAPEPGDGAPTAIDRLETSPVLFVANRGQWELDAVRFVHQGAGASVAMTDTGPVFRLFRETADAFADLMEADLG